MQHRRLVLAMGVAALGLAILPAPPARAAAAETRFGVLEWRGYPQHYLWRLEWEPVAILRDGAWLAPAGSRTVLPDTIYAPEGMGVFIPDGLASSFWGCDTFDVVIGRWRPGAIPVEADLEQPVPGTSGGGWSRWPLEDPAQVWHAPGRPEDLAGALAGLTRDARAQIEEGLPPGLEIDPEVPLLRENLRLARELEPGALELVGRMQGAVRLKGGGASSTVVLHFWASARDGARRFRYALLDLPRAGAARLSRRQVAVLESPGSGRPLAVFREEAERGRRTVLFELLSSGSFQPVFQSAWTGCGN